jgi:hypothetical protein
MAQPTLGVDYLTMARRMKPPVRAKTLWAVDRTLSAALWCQEARARAHRPSASPSVGASRRKGWSVRSPAARS